MIRSSLIMVSMALSCSILLSSCGVMFGGSKYNAEIIVEHHPNAEIYANGEKIGEGEAFASFDRNESLEIEVRKENCEPKREQFDPVFRAGNFILSLFSWGILGVAVDLGTGASYKPDHNNNSSVDRITDKNYLFSIDYSKCKEQ